eukprot:358984-Chlamydomonas_euryale.AAC.4
MGQPNPGKILLLNTASASPKRPVWKPAGVPEIEQPINPGIPRIPHHTFPHAPQTPYRFHECPRPSTTPPARTSCHTRGSRPLVRSLALGFPQIFQVLMYRHEYISVNEGCLRALEGHMPCVYCSMSLHGFTRFDCNTNVFSL